MIIIEPTCFSRLCYRYHELIELFLPSQDELNELVENGFSADYWGYDKPVSYHTYHWGMLDKIRYSFTPLRQNIILLLAALNNEL